MRLTDFAWYICGVGACLCILAGGVWVAAVFLAILILMAVAGYIKE